MTENRPAPDAAGPAGAPEVWRLAHPDHGALEFAVGQPDELHIIDRGYPRRRTPQGRGSGPATTAVPGCVLLRDGRVVARARRISDTRFSATADPPEPGKHTTASPPVSGPRVQVRTNVLDTAVRQVTFREGGQVVHFDPPPGSAAEARLEVIAASPWKRVAYPVAAGIGRSGWAIAVLLLLPLLGRVLEPVLEWIIERVPDVDIPWPDVSLPSIPWPDISLPSINLPEVAIPGWVEFLLEYSKVWVPLVVGVAIAVLAVRHSRRSREIKRRWAADGRDDSGRDERAGDGSGRDESAGGDRAGR